MYKYFVTSVLVFSLVLFSEIDSNAQTEPTATPQPTTPINVIQDIPITLPDAPNTQCKECPEDNFTTTNFLNHAKEKFSDKFPFDIVGNIPGGSSGVCGEKKEVCTLKETLGNLLRLLKYPIWIGFLLGLVRAI
jgi:hypothetical protein